MSREKILESQIVYKGNYVLSVREDKVVLPTNEVTKRVIIKFPEVAAIFPLLTNNTFLLVEQFRYPLGRELLEIPAGRVKPKENIISCARRELEEETGFQAGKVKEVLNFYVSPGYNTEKIHLFMATELEKISSFRGTEIARTITLTLDDALRMIKTGEIVDAKTIIGVCWVLQRKQK